MTCQSCGAAISEGQSFCGKCGYKVAGETLASLSERVAKLEDSRSKLTHQNYLEIETAEKVMTRVRTWTTLILYFAGIPAAVAALALVVTFGKGTYDLHSIAAEAKGSVNEILIRARSVASETVATADDALKTSKQVRAEMSDVRRQVSELKTELDRRSSEVQELTGRLRDTQGRAATLADTVKSQSQQVARVSQQLKVAETQKNFASLREAYPGLFGEHVAGWRDGWIDPKAKAAGDIYVAFMLWESRSIPNKLDGVKVGEAMQSLQDHNYRVLLGPVSLFATSGRTSQGAGASFDALSCDLKGIELHGPPCILYFNENLKMKASEVRSLVSPAQVVPEDKVKYVQPTGMEPLFQELLQKSRLDIVVVLGLS
jgi:uncharacterized coiled-coil protein SlyX